LTTAPDGVGCTAHYPGSGGVVGIMAVTMPLLSTKDFAVAFHQPAEDDTPLYK